MSQQKSKTAAGNKPLFDLELTYIKDSRFHAPQSGELFRSQTGIPAPELNLQLDTKTHKLSAERYEVTLKLMVTAVSTQSKDTAYQVEVSQAGLFVIANIQEEDFTYIVNVSCPSILFPYARQVLSGLVGRAGFPSMVLPQMNFELLHQQYLKRRQKINQAPVQTKH